MALYDDFPYTNFHSLNLDWIVKKLSELENGESSEESSSTATLARNLTGNYPYTNFHSLNLDWIIRSMYELESDFETVKNEWQGLIATGLLNDQIKNAILQCFENVAWVNDQGQTYYDALHDLFFPPVIVDTLTAVLDQGERVFHTGEDVNVIKNYLTVTAKLTDGTLVTVPSDQYILTGSLSQDGLNIITVTYMNASTTVAVNAVAISLVSISAVYSQSGTVYDNQTLDSLRSDLVVTALWDDETTTTVTDYTLSGTLTEGTSTITVLYDHQSTTFNVTVTHAAVQYTITNTLTQCTNSNSASVINELTAYSGTLTANSGYAMGTVSITMGGTDITSTAYDSSTGAISIASVTGNIVITAEAVEDVGWESGVPYTFTITNGYRVDASTFELVEDSTCSYVELPCRGVDYLERYWSQFGGNCRMDFYDANNAHLQENTVTSNGTYGCTVSRDATKVIISGVTGRMQNLTVTPYGYPELGENTVWEADTIYVPEESTLSGTTIETGYMFGALAETISISIGYATSNVRGQYMFYDQNKDRISMTTTAEIIGGTGIWRTPVSVPEGTYYVKVLFFNQSSVYNFGNALDNIRIVYNRTV